MDITKTSATAAASAYQDATRIAERIISETSQGEAGPQRIDEPMRPNFSELVGGSLQASRDVGYRGESQSTKALANETDLHEMILAVSNTELTLKTVVAVRDRVINAYQDIIKMPI